MPPYLQSAVSEIRHPYTRDMSWHIHTCDVTYSYVVHDSSRRVNPPYDGQDACIRVIWLYQISDTISLRLLIHMSVLIQIRPYVWYSMTIHPENAAFLKSTKSTNPDDAVSHGNNSNWDFDWARGGGGPLAPQLPGAITAGPNACGEKSMGLSIQGFIYPGEKNLGTSFQKFISPGIWGPNSPAPLIWTYPDGARQLGRGAPRRHAPIWICTEEFEFFVGGFLGCSIFSGICHMHASCPWLYQWESWHTYEWVISHMWMIHVKHMNGSYV